MIIFGRTAAGLVVPVLVDDSGIIQTSSGGAAVDISAKVNNSIAISLVTGTLTTLTFDTEVYDTDNIYTPAASDRLVCQTAGKYIISAGVAFGANVTGMRRVTINRNGITEILARSEFMAVTTAGQGTATTLSVPVQLAVGDYILLRARQDSGGDLPVVGGGGYSPMLAMHKIG